MWRSPGNSAGSLGLLFTRWVRTRRVYYASIRRTAAAADRGPQRARFWRVGVGEGAANFPVPPYCAKPILVAATIASRMARGVFSELTQPSGCASDLSELTQMIGIGLRWFRTAE